MFNDVKRYYRFYITDQWKLKDVQLATTTRNLRCLSSFSAMVQRSWGQWLRRRSSLPKLNQVNWHLKCTEQREEESRRGWLRLKDLKLEVQIGKSKDWYCHDSSLPHSLSRFVGSMILVAPRPRFSIYQTYFVFWLLGPHEMLYHCPSRCPD